MSIKIGINGFGRIGRLVMRAAIAERQEFDVAAINDPNIPARDMSYLLKYDSVHGKCQAEICADENCLTINGKQIYTYSEREPERIPWGALGVDYVVESTGVFCTTKKASAHLAGGAKKVVITAPAKDDITPTFVCGVNTDGYTRDMKIVSGASCTTNCLAPLLKVICDNFGVEEALMTTVHSATNTQPTVDAASHKDLCGGRSASVNIIPSSTGAAKACALVLPELKGKITGMAFRVPTVDVSAVDLTVRTVRETSLAEINRCMKDASLYSLAGVLGYTDEAVVSSDFYSDERTCIYDSTASMELNPRFFKLIAWYDNEWGYSNKILDLIKCMNDR